MSTNSFWHLHFNLTEFTPREVEGITTLSTLMQRDWRHRGFLAKSDKHARFTLLPLAEALVMKMFADRGIGPGQSHSVAPRIAKAIALEILSFRDGAWGGTPPAAVFDAIPKNARALTSIEKYAIESRAHETPLWRKRRLERGDDPDAEIQMWDEDKKGELADRVLRALRIKDVERSKHVIWWPNDEIVFGDYDELTSGRDLDEGRPNPRYDGVALVMSIPAIAANIARKLPRPLVSTMIDVFEKSPPEPLFWADHGETSVTFGKAAYKALLAEREKASAGKAFE